MSKKIVDKRQFFFDNIFLHYSTKSNGNRQQMTVFSDRIFCPRFTKYYGIRQKFFVESGIILSKFIKKNCWTMVLQFFSLNFAPRKLKNLQNITNFAHEIYHILSNCEWKDCRIHSTIFSCRIRLTPGRVSFCRKKLNARLLKN